GHVEVSDEAGGDRGGVLGSRQDLRALRRRLEIGDLLHRADITDVEEAQPRREAIARRNRRVVHVVDVAVVARMIEESAEEVAARSDGGSEGIRAVRGVMNV